MEITKEIIESIINFLVDGAPKFHVDKNNHKITIGYDYSINIWNEGTRNLFEHSISIPEFRYRECLFIFLTAIEGLIPNLFQLLNIPAYQIIGVYLLFQFLYVIYCFFCEDQNKDKWNGWGYEGIQWWGKPIKLDGGCSSI